MGISSSKLGLNLSLVRERIDRAALRVRRSKEDITLVAVSKTQSSSRILELYGAGVRHFGENRVQERESKLTQLSGIDAVWHMIGHLQKNKSARAARLFDCIDSVDSIALAEKLDRAMADFAAEKTQARKAAGESELFDPANRLRVLIEVKLDPEPAKTGVDGKDLSRLAEAILQLPQLNLRGLMGVPPYFDDPENARPYFRRLREFRDSVREQSGPQMLPVLSMGMSHDFEIAIEEGATEVRIGTALFGERERV